MPNLRSPFWLDKVQIKIRSSTSVSEFIWYKNVGILNNQGTTNSEPYPHKNGEQNLGTLGSCSTFFNYMNRCDLVLDKTPFMV